MAAIASAISVTRGSTGWPSSASTSWRRVSAMDRASGGDADERQGLGGTKENRLAQAGAEGLAVEDHLARLAFDRDFVGFLDMDAVELGVPKLADQAGPDRAEHGNGLLLD